MAHLAIIIMKEPAEFFIIDGKDPAWQAYANEISKFIFPFIKWPFISLENISLRFKEIFEKGIMNNLRGLGRLCLGFHDPNII